MLMPLGVFLPAELLLSRECCQAGDLLEIDRKLYAHWVVYIGNNEVVHVPETRKNKVVVEKCSLESVAQDCLVRINNKQVPAKDRGVSELAREVVVANALSCVGSTVRYNFVVSNSEHFVTRLKYGIGWSDQAKAMRHSMSSLSPTPSSPRQVEKAHLDIWSEIHNILTSSPPVSPSSSP
ncbi:phospholipase A and acyltransferase 2-like [Babylonia areolata]|uniref:phospholipase A and acyltransferase 2-like n=1 Tax=Babylonia areolata TaxID=304850 RepID=UPI003FD41C37